MKQTLLGEEFEQITWKLNKTVNIFLGVPFTNMD